MYNLIIMIRNKILLILLIILLFHSPLLANSIDAPVKTYISTYASNEKSKRGLFTTDVIVPIYYPDTKDSLLFFNPKYTYTTPEADEINQGLGFRHIFNDAFILGVNTFFDRRMAHSGKWYSQTGIGFELLSYPVDMRLNWYKPTTKYKIVDTTYGFGPTSLIQYDHKEEPLQGLDFEIGYPVLDKYTKTRAYTGGFFYQSRLSKNINGFRFRTETKVTDWLNIDTIINTKSDGQVEFIAGLRVTVPLQWGSFFKKKEKKENKAEESANTYIKDRIFERIVRDIDIQSQSATSQSKKHDMVYVDNSNTTGIEDGSYEHPYTKIQDGVDYAIGDKWVYVREGSGSYIEGVNLRSGITLWGSGYNGGFAGILNTDYPVIDGEDLSCLVIENINDCTVMGLSVKDSIFGVVQIANSQNIVINRCVISENHLQGGGLYIRSGDGQTVSGITITGNTFLNNASAGVYVESIGGDDTALIEDITISGNNLSGICCVHFHREYGTIRNVLIENNTISDYEHTGIMFNNVAPYDSTSTCRNITIRNNIIMNSISNGIYFAATGGSGADNITISGNTVLNVSGQGISIVAGNLIDDVATITNVKISGNIIKDVNGDGIVMACYNDGSFLGCEVRRNTITGNTRYGVVTVNDSDNATLAADLGTEASWGYNSIYNNATYDVLNDTSNQSIDAMYNWWGQASGPNPDKISGDVDYTLWLNNNPN